MNIYESDILRFIGTNTYVNQRILSQELNISLGKINLSLASLIAEGYLTEKYELTEVGKQFLSDSKPQSAIILAAGYGLRMVPINTEVPKGLLEINGEPLIERLIKQLHEVNVYKIYVVVGYLKEKYEYLIDKFDVELVVNMEYSTKNNLHSLLKVSDYIHRSYILPCDMWCKNNPFHECEPVSWYMVLDRMSKNSTVKINRRRELVPVNGDESGNSMVGISYINNKDSETLTSNLKTFAHEPAYDNSFWEDALFSSPESIIYAYEVSASEVVEINTVEQLRDIDHHSEQLQTPALQIISETLHVPFEQVTNIVTLKKGMTNRSFLFSCANQRYIMRIPGEGTSQLINRENEAAVYAALNDSNICDDVLYINPKNGYKITKFLDSARNCNPKDDADLAACMRKLREFHNKHLEVGHSFDIWSNIDYYESLWNNQPSMYQDYQLTKEHVFSLSEYIEKQPREYCLTHIDAVPDNFLILENGDIRLIDWEYAGTQDPHVDIAMFCIYSLYNRQEADHIIDLYFENNCPKETRIKIYCYMAACGLLWSNWCEYKCQLGIEFGEYALRQYRYAKDYYRIAKQEMENSKNA